MDIFDVVSFKLAILEDKNHLFIELTGRLLPYYDIYERIRNLIKQCDQISLKHYPIVPIKQIYKAPCKCY